MVELSLANVALSQLSFGPFRQPTPIRTAFKIQGDFLKMAQCFIHPRIATVNPCYSAFEDEVLTCPNF